MGEQTDTQELWVTFNMCLKTHPLFTYVLDMNSV